MEKIALGLVLETNTALGFASCYISLSTAPSCYFFPYCTRGSALTNMRSYIRIMHALYIAIPCMFVYTHAHA